MDQYTSTPSRYSHPQSVGRISTLPGTTSNAQRPVEVYHLSDSANLTIPDDIREQFQQDDQGRLLFFTTPPLDVLPPTKKGEALGHSARYLAAKLRREDEMKEKRKLNEAAHRQDEANKKKRRLDEAMQLANRIEELKVESLVALQKQMEDEELNLWKELYGDQWEEAREIEKVRLAKSQKEWKKRMEAEEESARKIKEREFVSLKNPEVFLDDIDPRY